MRKIVSSTAACLLLGSTGAHAVDIDGFSINGWMDAAVAWTNVDYLPSGVEPTYISRIRKAPSWDQDSNVGLQVTKYIRPDVSLTTQLYAAALTAWEVEATWAFLKWEPNDHWQVRVGRVRTDPYMFSDYVDVGYAYPWIRPPVEVYTQAPVDNFTGIDLRFKMAICKRDLAATVFWGATNTTIQFPNIAFPAVYEQVDIRLRHLWSLNAKYGDEVFSIRAGYETARATLFPNAGSTLALFDSVLNSLQPFIGGDYVDYFEASNDRVSFYGVGYQFDWKNIVSMAELVKRESTLTTSGNVIGWYVMGGYRIQQFLPHITFARERLNKRKTEFPVFINDVFLAGLGESLTDITTGVLGVSPFAPGGAGDQTSLTLGLRWDVIPGVALKGEYSHVHPDHGNAGLFFPNPGKAVNVWSFALSAVM